MSLTEDTRMGLQSKALNEPGCFGLAVAALLRERYPFHTMKLVSADLGCTLKTAESLLGGHLSARSMTRLVASYGWDFMAEAMTRVTGQSLREYIEHQAVISEQESRTWDAKRREFEGLAARLSHRGSEDHSRGVRPTSERWPRRP